MREAVREGAKVVFGGDTAKPEGFENGYWYMPTILAEVTNDMKVVQEEIFGPVVVVMPFKDEQEVVTAGQ